MDVNENVYKGKFADGLNQAGVKLDSAFTIGFTRHKCPLRI